MKQNKNLKEVEIFAIDKFGYEELRAIMLPSEPPSFIIIRDEKNAEQKIFKISSKKRLSYVGTELKPEGLYISLKETNIEDVDMNEDDDGQDEYFILRSDSE